MIKPLALIALLTVSLLAGCSGTTVSGAWRNPDYAGAVRKIYVVGIAGQDLNRRIFEEEFAKRLQGYGAVGVASYKDLPDPQTAGKEAIGERVKANGADSILMVRMAGNRSGDADDSGWVRRGYGYDYSHPYAPDYVYRDWGSYYERCCYTTSYVPPTMAQYQVATIEANLYSAASGELIWAAQLEAVIDAHTVSQIADFAETVSRELRQQGLL